MTFDIGHAAETYIRQLEQAIRIQSIVGKSRYLLLSFDKLASGRDRETEVARLSRFFAVSPEPFLEFLNDPNRGGVNYSSGHVGAVHDSADDQTVVAQIPNDLRERVLTLQKEAGLF